MNLSRRDLRQLSLEASSERLALERPLIGFTRLPVRRHPVLRELFGVVCGLAFGGLLAFAAFLLTGASPLAALVPVVLGLGLVALWNCAPRR